MFRFNLPGILIGMLAMALGFGAVDVFNLTNENAGFAVAGGLMLIADAVYRLRLNSAESRWDRWLSGRQGGFLILPLWLTGIVLLALPMYFD